MRPVLYEQKQLGLTPLCFFVSVLKKAHKYNLNIKYLLSHFP